MHIYSGYHVVRVLNIWPRLRGLAGPAGQHEPDPESDTRLQLIGVPAEGDVSPVIVFQPLNY
jgi:hypothetical protein